MSEDTIPYYMKTPYVFYPKQEIATNDNHQNRAAIRAARLGTALADVRLKTGRKLIREEYMRSREIAQFIEDQAKTAFIAGVEAQSDAIQREWTARETRIAELENRLFLMERHIQNINELNTIS